MLFTDVARSLEEQVLHAQALVGERRFTAAAAVVALLPGVDRAHIAAVLTELEREHAHNAIEALAIIRALHSQTPRPRLRLVVDRSDKSLT